MTMLEAAELDVRQIAPRERHSLIFATFDRLQSGEAFLLVNDHNPVRLLRSSKQSAPARRGGSRKKKGPSAG